MKSSKRLSIGLVFVDESPAYVSHPAHSYLLAELSNYLSEGGYSLAIQGARPGKLSDALMLKRAGTDALCVVMSGTPTQRHRFMTTIASTEQPLLVFHEPRRTIKGDVCFVREDDFSGGYVLAGHLLKKGCRRLLMLLPEVAWPAMEERLRGARRAVSEYGRGCTLKTLVCGDAGIDATHFALQRYFNEFGQPDGILAGHDQMGIATLKFARQTGIDVPSLLKVTGFNAFEFWKYSDPLLTTIKAPTYELGWQAGRHLLARLQTGVFPRPEIVLPVALELGGST